MFTTCIHCTARLGANEAFETFPVGSRLAFDSRRGRLWVVCRACARWNLSPLEERWEAIESMERRFRDSRLRVSTDHVGLARLREGVDLIRIGEPQRPEMAAWRYGDQFGRRRKRQLLVTGTVVGTATAIIGGMVAVGVQVGSFAGFYANGTLWDTLIHGRQGQSIGPLRLPDGTLVEVLRRHARMSALVHAKADGLLQLRLEHTKGTTVLLGDDAMRAAARLMPTVNRFGGSSAQVQQAVGLLEEAGDPQALLWRVQQRRGWVEGNRSWGSASHWATGTGGRTRVQKLPGVLHALDAPERLAMEMALHEAQEREAMEGELAELERAWREAEEIADIADGLLVPPAIEAKAAALKERTRAEGDGEVQ